MLLLASTLVHGHASMIMPWPRNAVDSLTKPWSGGKHPNTGWIEPYNCKCTNGTEDCNSGQSCFWFSQGCTIGCDACDGQGQRYPNWDHCPGTPKPPPLTPHLPPTLSLPTLSTGAPRRVSVARYRQDTSVQPRAVWRNVG